MVLCRFNWGLNVRKKADRILKLLEEGHVLKEERDRARKLSRGIQGFGSFCQRSSEQSSPSSASFLRSNSDFSSHEDRNSNSNGGQNDAAQNQMLQKSETSINENMAPNRDELHLWNLKRGSNPLLDRGNEDSRLGIFKGEDDHPFHATEKHASVSLLAGRDGIRQGC